jgi:DNA-binding transcriptional MocR family regulator
LFEHSINGTCVRVDVRLYRLSMIDPHSGIPRHRQLANDLRKRIVAGEWAPGSMMPSETRLSQENGVGRGTVRRAVAILRTEGLVDAAPGYGTRVREQVEHVEEIAGEPGQVVTARMPTPAERAEFGMADGVPMIVVRHPDGWVDVYPADQYAVRIPIR